MARATSAAVVAAWRRIGHWGWLAVLAVCLLIAVLAVSKARPKAQANSGDDARLLAADEALGAAVRAGDKEVVRRLLALQFTFVDADGKSHARKDFLANLKVVAAARAGDAKVRSYGLLAMVTGHRKSAQDSEVFFLDIWAKQKGAWRALVMQDVALAAAGAPVAASAPPTGQTKPYECKNPCQSLPYRVRSAAEQDIVATFQAAAKAVVAHNADEWAKHVADDFMLYGTGGAPMSKSGRIAVIERQKESNAAVTVGEVQAMRLSVYGDGAAMIATHHMPDNSRPSYRAARVWVKRNGQWQIALSAHTDIK